MKNLLLIIFTLLLTINVNSQTFFNFLLLNTGDNQDRYVGIVENELSSNIFTCNMTFASDGKIINVNKFDISGEYINSTQEYITTSTIYPAEICRDIHFRNDSLWVFASDLEYKPILYKYSSDLSYVEKQYLNVDGCPWRIKYNQNDITIMCYDGNYLSGDYFTKFITLDYNLNILDTITFMNLDPWDFQILNDTIYFSTRDVNGLFSIKKIVGNTVENFLVFNNNYLVTQFEIINNEHFIVSNRYYEFSLLHVFNSQGIEISTDTINGYYDEFLKLTNIDNKAYISWGDNSLHLKIIESNLGVIYHELLNPIDTSFSVSTIYSTSNNVYIYGKWTTDGIHNPIIVKTDDAGSFSPGPVNVQNYVAPKKETFKFYPNPVIDNITIEKYGEVKEILIYDERGRIVYRTNVENSNSINLSFLSTGIYFITDKYYYHKLIKK